MLATLDRWFRLKQHGTTTRIEMLGGLTTFAAMAYIIVVNPAILSAAQFEPGPSTIATILASVFGCLLMGIYANRPIAVAPYMGENAFIAFTAKVAMRAHCTSVNRPGASGSTYCADTVCASLYLSMP